MPLLSVTPSGCWYAWRQQHTAETAARKAGCCLFSRQCRITLPTQGLPNNCNTHRPASFQHATQHETSCKRKARAGIFVVGDQKPQTPWWGHERQQQGNGCEPLLPPYMPPEPAQTTHAGSASWEPDTNSGSACADRRPHATPTVSNTAGCATPTPATHHPSPAARQHNTQGTAQASRCCPLGQGTNGRSRQHEWEP